MKRDFESANDQQQAPNENWQDKKVNLGNQAFLPNIKGFSVSKNSAFEPVAPNLQFK